MAKGFSGKDAKSTLRKQAVGVVVMIRPKSDTSRRFYYVRSGPNLWTAVRLKGFGKSMKMDSLVNNTASGSVLAAGDGMPRSYDETWAIVDKYRKSNKPKKKTYSGFKKSSTSFVSDKPKKTKPYPWATSGKSGGYYTPGGGFDQSGDMFGGDIFGGALGPSKPYKPKVSTGGVLIRDDGMILLREPANFFDNYAWTHAKGGVDAGETDEQAALREVLEETGWIAEVVAPLPGEFTSPSGVINRYFLLRPISEDMTPADPNTKKKGPIPGRKYPEWETWRTKWFSYDDALEHISYTQKTSGRKRDTEVLKSAYALWQSMQGKPKTNSRRRRRRIRSVR